MKKRLSASEDERVNRLRVCGGAGFL